MPINPEIQENPTNTIGDRTSINSEDETEDYTRLQKGGQVVLRGIRAILPAITLNGEVPLFLPAPWAQFAGAAAFILNDTISRAAITATTRPHPMQRLDEIGGLDETAVCLPTHPRTRGVLKESFLVFTGGSIAIFAAGLPLGVANYLWNPGMITDNTTPFEHVLHCAFQTPFAEVVLGVPVLGCYFLARAAFNRCIPNVPERAPDDNPTLHWSQYLGHYAVLRPLEAVFLFNALRQLLYFFEQDIVLHNPLAGVIAYTLQAELEALAQLTRKLHPIDSLGHEESKGYVPITTTTELAKPSEDTESGYLHLRPSPTNSRRAKILAWYAFRLAAVGSIVAALDYGKDAALKAVGLEDEENLPGGPRFASLYLTTAVAIGVEQAIEHLAVPLGRNTVLGLQIAKEGLGVAKHGIGLAFTGLGQSVVKCSSTLYSLANCLHNKKNKEEVASLTADSSYQRPGNTL